MKISPWTVEVMEQVKEEDMDSRSQRDNDGSWELRVASLCINYLQGERYTAGHF